MTPSAQSGPSPFPPHFEVVVLPLLLCFQVQSGQSTKVLLANCLVHLRGRAGDSGKESTRGGERRGGRMGRKEGRENGKEGGKGEGREREGKWEGGEGRERGHYSTELLLL